MMVARCIRLDRDCTEPGVAAARAMARGGAPARGASLGSSQVQTRNPRARWFADQIIEAQHREIAGMNALVPDPARH